jgi:hypothetical protein
VPNDLPVPVFEFVLDAEGHHELLAVDFNIAVLTQATIWLSLATIRDAIQQTNAISLAACGSDERPL